MEPIISSILFYALVIGFCEICRRGCDKFFIHSGSSLSPKMFLIEAIGALQAITCVYENQLVIKFYGLTGFAIAVFVLLNVHRLSNRGCVLSPAAVSEQYLNGRLGIFESFSILTAELIGGTFAFQLAAFFWRLGLSDQHLQHYDTFQCVLAYKTPIMMVAAYEFFAVLLIRLLVGYVSRHRPRLSPYTTALSISLFLTLGMALVGPVSLNPLIAYGRFGGCEGISHSEHLLTYWLAPLSGWIIGWQIDKRSQTASKSSEKSPSKTSPKSQSKSPQKSPSKSTPKSTAKSTPKSTAKSATKNMSKSQKKTQ